PKALDEFGIEKSFISLFIITPVDSTINWEPNNKLIVVVRVIAMPEASAVTTWDVPGLEDVNARIPMGFDRDDEDD
ncbi:MAG: hypothetical protein Q9198_006086, partial [Flavoplaca austrocitrina]